MTHTIAILSTPVVCPVVNLSSVGGELCTDHDLPINRHWMVLLTMGDILFVTAEIRTTERKEDRVAFEFTKLDQKDIDTIETVTQEETL